MQTMIHMLQPLKTESLKDLFVSRFEQLILSGELSIGEKLPPERELALRLGVSRPVVHEGLVELAARGLVAIRPRKGTVVNDFRKEGSLALLNSLVNYQGGLDPALLENLLDMRTLFETEVARLAARHRTDAQLQAIGAVLEAEKAARGDMARFSALDFDFHHALAMASGNDLYTLLLNSFRQIYRHLAGQFYSLPRVARAVLTFHEDILAAVEQQNADAAAEAMGRMLDHGRQRLHQVIDKGKRSPDTTPGVTSFPGI
jgi:GntR family transcriptional regulator, transcriptional repressor for pyruvate dehydrogenase complex